MSESILAGVDLRKLAGNVFLVFYVWITLCAFLLTTFRIRILIPKRIVTYAYGMMAPYQSYEKTHGELRAEGLFPDGSWEQIDLHPYYPVMKGEELARQIITAYDTHFNEATRQQIRDAYARRLLTLEREQGNPYQGVRMYWEQWPVIGGEYDAGKTEADTTSTLLSEAYAE